MVHLFLCYSPILHKELKDLGERYVIHAIHPKTRKEFWAYEYTDVVVKHLDSRPKRNKKDEKVKV